MGACCSADIDRTVLLISQSDGSTRLVNIEDVRLFEEGGTDFVLKAEYRSGPLVTFGAGRSPQGLKPLVVQDIPKLVTCMKKFDLFHGGEQLLFAAWGTVRGGVETSEKPRLIVLTALGRLFVVKPGAKVTVSCHVTHMSRANLQGAGDTLELSFSDQRPPWVVRSSAGAAAELQKLIWIVHSTAHTQLLLLTNMAQPPVERLPPLSVDGNLHTAFVIFAHAQEAREHEDVLLKPDPTVSPALSLIRQWLPRMEVDVSAWKPEMIVPLALAMRCNGAFMAFKAVGADLTGRVGTLAPMLANNTRLIVLNLERVRGRPAEFALLGRALAANAAASLAVIKLNHCQLGDEGAAGLAQGLARLRPNLLAELHMNHCAVNPQRMAEVLGALGQQRGLLQLHLEANNLAGAAASLVGLLGVTTKLEQLSIGESGADAAAFAAMPPNSLRALKLLDLSGIAWADATLAVLRACGPQVARLKLSGGAATASSAAKQPFLFQLCEWAAARPKLEGIDLSAHQAAGTLLPDLLPVLMQARSHLPPRLPRLPRSASIGTQLAICGARASAPKPPPAAARRPRAPRGYASPTRSSATPACSSCSPRSAPPPGARRAPARRPSAASTSRSTCRM